MRRQITSSITRAVMPAFVRGASYGLVAICATLAVLGAITYSVVAAEQAPPDAVEHAASLTAPPPEHPAFARTTLEDTANPTETVADASLYPLTFVSLLPLTPTIDHRLVQHRAEEAAAQAARHTVVELTRLKAAWEPDGPTAGDLLFQLSTAPVATATLPAWDGPAETAQQHLDSLTALPTAERLVSPPPPAPAPARPRPTYRVLTVAPADLRAKLEATFGDQAEFAYNVIMCESHANAAANTGNGYYGMWQFDLPTWRSVGGGGLPSDASVDEQIMRARMLYDARGWQPWHCALVIAR